MGVPHGVRGDIKIRSFTEDKDSLAKFEQLYMGSKYEPVTLKVKFPNKDGFVAQVEGITNREKAQEVKGLKLYVKREQLPETERDVFYISDLNGLKVVDSENQVVGHIKAVQNFGAGDVLEITLQQAMKPVGKEVMIPFQQEFVPDVDILEGVVKVNLSSWLSTLKESEKNNSTNGDEK